MHKFLIVKVGGTFADYAAERGDFEDWTVRGMSLAESEWETVNPQNGANLPDPAGFAGAVITGSHDMVTDGTPWITDTAAWVRRAVDAGLPLLGICFGHQLMADALGGKADYHPDGVEIGTANITRTRASEEDPLFRDLPEVFPGHVTHSQTALKLPQGATLLATGSHDPHQSFRVGESAWGVQFHPEFDAPAIHEYISRREADLAASGRDVAAIRATVRDTPQSASLLKLFANYCRTR
ncbi:glutamine amidotransferase [uncultured Pseudodesulfovibrio sp.]|uniref:glutamine amidotransferase n=1 Tax=uncultured Pseudodesulfovibrio sp. TaxID=2035858 RepID=UPI0029C6B3B6|nr:glutamine amidotransferase [uncultured Pseudodesulfovibrio sp.]